MRTIYRSRTTFGSAMEILMLFNSLVFAVFLPIVFALYWIIGSRNYRTQNLLVLIASYVFYGWWDWRFLFLIFISTIVDYWVGIGLEETESPRRRRMLIGASLVANLGLLGFFKYFNFFIDSFASLLTSAGLHADIPTLRIILPVGISFYTFQTMSYSLDIYRRQLRCTRDPIAFFAFVTFFPQLVAGPIERARDLLPQFLVPRRFDRDKATDGLRQILWGFFKKVVIADNMSGHVQSIYSNYAILDSLTLALGTFFFAVQIYCDFSGYSDIAIGVSRLFGFSLSRNFAYPYFSRDIAEFWRRWHISLSSWFRDYVFIPLGGNRCSLGRQVWNIFVTFTVSGLWHGANWTFVMWGALNALYYLPLMLSQQHKSHTDLPAAGRLLPRFREAGAISLTFFFTLIAWVFFRSANLGQAFGILSRAFTTAPQWPAVAMYSQPLILAGCGFVIEWIQRDKPHGLASIRGPIYARWPAYAAVAAAILVFGVFGSTEFIYFQF